MVGGPNRKSLVQLLDLDLWVYNFHKFKKLSVVTFMVVLGTLFYMCVICVHVYTRISMCEHKCVQWFKRMCKSKVDGRCRLPSISLEAGSLI